ncbi:MAG: hypothetical protein Q9O24_03510 [Gammaproteobacteria bacterium]|nr:hypothetical protein [Gammaproteobacteria bacterium]
MRINARLDDSYEEKFHRMQSLQNKNRTEVLKEALDLYFSVELKQAEESAWQRNQKILKKLAGIASGAEDLSENYKTYLDQGLKQKHDLGR